MLGPIDTVFGHQAVGCRMDLKQVVMLGLLIQAHSKKGVGIRDAMRKHMSTKTK